MCNRIEGGVDDLTAHNVPAILELYPESGLSPKFVTVNKIGGNTISFYKDENSVVVVPLTSLSVYWHGTAYILWKNFFNYSGVIPVNSSRDSILTLKIHLRKIGFENVAISPFYDETAVEAVKIIQERNGLNVDGIVGPITMISLYNEDDTLPIPHILKTTSDAETKEEGEDNRSS
jgi:general secretion pathway protein A